MNVANITLLVISSLLGIALMALPIIFVFTGWYAWQEIPREIYNAEKQQVFGLRPIYFWIASALLSQLSHMLDHSNWANVGKIAENASLAILVMVLISHLVWAIRIRSGVNTDKRLRHFAGYALGGSAASLLVIATGVMMIASLKK